MGGGARLLADISPMALSCSLEGKENFNVEGFVVQEFRDEMKDIERVKCYVRSPFRPRAFDHSHRAQPSHVQ